VFASMVALELTLPVRFLGVMSFEEVEMFSIIGDSSSFEQLVKLRKLTNNNKVIFLFMIK